ncbi:hypothetical protein QIH87_48320 (plasmid) [Bradyrhizobium elkanii]|jgi:ribonuclease VapC|uniref:PIN domain-containing protein n=1 Tax=Bradyrhizobium elkanii TaxID=29448 RepID=A0ABV4ERA6_BRAEL|nr:MULTISPECIES: hypothetical protein [Bradyrhizobium]MCP1758678.1 ribonuclease VapC [Bradyrhizobium elkanii]MCP1975697.1 ribonuclease VapC [Bradyrhizobium elkanii]MCP1984876.1 ribonuclease VapC [Bradyrhizobium elkanii]MCS3890770.1 ribonuclease VapC [Bradyrhizobium elkanii]MCS4113045.1 ribonuclease VapC [Bradyrhizobium elkanii]
MFIDASALTAMLTHEDEARELLARVQQSTARLTFRWPSGRRRLPSARELDLPIAAAAEAVESYLARIEIKMVNVALETARARRLRPLRQGPTPGAAQFRGLFRLRLRPISWRTVDVQGRRFSADRYRGGLTSATFEASLSVAEVMNIDSRRGHRTCAGKPAR